MKVSDFDFELPEVLIAKEPVAERDTSRMMALSMSDGRVEHRAFGDLPDYLNKGDMLMMNNTRVLPCRLRGIKKNGRELDVLLVRPIQGNRWEVLSPGGYSGPLEIAPGVSATMVGGLEADLHYEGDLSDILDAHGEMPLPPYLKRRAHERDRQWYQTTYAEVEGSIAAPTAGLHFTPELIGKLEQKGVLVRYLTLHVGKGTFMPIRAENTDDHRMESEYFEINESLMQEIASLKGRLFTVGTTTTRALEAAVSGRFEPTSNKKDGVISGSTDIFISPGYEFRACRGLLTNFHLPGSTPLMLAAALAGRENLLSAYAKAIEKSYRFFSYGDAMLIF